jgi:short-subunit dehydrogenase
MSDDSRSIAPDETRPLAVVTGASSGIGLELARRCAEHGYDLVVAADEPGIEAAAEELRALGAAVEPVEIDLATMQGVDALYEIAKAMNRPVDVLCANAGRGSGKPFLDQNFDDVRRALDANVTGTLYLVHKFGRDMRTRGRGRIMIAGSVAGYMPGAFNAVYNGAKAFLNAFSFALRAELEGAGVTVACLMPGVTDTAFFARERKDDPVDLARIGFEAMLRGEGDLVSGWKNKLRAILTSVTPSAVLAERHRAEAEQTPSSRNERLTERSPRLG